MLRPASAAFVSRVGFEFDEVVELDRLEFSPVDPPGFLSPQVSCICEDPRGHLWFGTAGGGVVEHDPVSGSWRHRVENRVFGNTLVLACVALPCGDVLFEVYGDDDVRYRADQDILVRVDDKETELEGATSDVEVGDEVQAWLEQRFGAVTVHITDRVALDSGEVWYGTLRRGVIVHDPTHGTWRHIHRFGDNPSTGVKDLHVDGTGQVWVSTRSGGVSVHAPDEDAWTEYGVVGGIGAGGKRITAAIADARGRLWFGATAMWQFPDVRYGGGITLYDPHEHSWTTWHSLDDDEPVEVNAFWSDGGRELWAGTETGLAVFGMDEAAWTWVRDGESPGEAPVVSFSQMDGRVWAGTRDGTIHRQHGRNSWRYQGFEEGLPDDGKTAILSIQLTQHVSMPVRENRYRWAFASDGRVYATDSTGKSWEATEVSALVPGLRIDLLAVDEDGALWTHEHDGTVHVRDKLEAPWRTYLAPESSDGKWVTSRYVTHGRVVWIAYDFRQLCRFDSPGYPDRCWTMDDGLGGPGAEAMVEDRDDGLWLAAPSYHAESRRTIRPGGTLTLLDHRSPGKPWPVVMDGLPEPINRAALVHGASEELCWARPTGLAQTNGHQSLHVRLDPVNDWDTALDGGPGGCWAGQLDGGVVWVEDGVVQRRWTTREGLPHDHVTDISQRPGVDRIDAWVGTAGGAARIGPSGVITTVETDGDAVPAPIGQVDHVHATADGGAILLRDRRTHPARPGQRVRPRWEGEIFRVSPAGAVEWSTDLYGRGTVHALTVGADGDVWLGRSNGLYRLVGSRLIKIEIARAEYCGADVRHLVSSGSGVDWTLWMAMDRYYDLPAYVVGYQPEIDRWIRVELGAWDVDADAIDMLEVAVDGSLVVMAQGAVFRGQVP